MITWREGDRVEGGDVWPDYDTGVVLSVGDEAREIADFYRESHSEITNPVWVAWDSGFDTLEEAADLRPKGERPIESPVEEDDLPIDSQIEALRREAWKAGDLEQVEICDRALDGDQSARRECARVIHDARAMSA